MKLLVQIETTLIKFKSWSTFYDALGTMIHMAYNLIFSHPCRQENSSYRLNSLTIYAPTLKD